MKKKKARVIAFYLPQFHPIPENDEWWGKGFTEWTNVAKAQPLFRSHQQPVFPSELGYYDLRLAEVKAAQAALAKEYGIEGFCYWHYWFGNGKRILETPFNQVLNSGEPNLPFCLGWANESWTGIWHGAPGKILLEQTYPGEEDYRAHFYSLLPAFKDKRYIAVNGKPLFVIYKPEIFECDVFTRVWNELAVKEGLNGFCFLGVSSLTDPTPLGLDGLVPIAISPGVRSAELAGIRRKFGPLYKAVLKIRSLLPSLQKKPRRVTYSSFIEALNKMEINIKQYPNIIPRWDNTPRSGKNGIVLLDSTPQLFKKHIKDMLAKVEERPDEERILFLKSWNEWAEGNYVEPDAASGRAYLEAIKEALESQE